MNIIKKATAFCVALFLSVAAPVAMAVVDPNVTAAVTATTSGFTDNFAPVALMFVGISVTVAVVLMAVRWFRRAAK